MTFNRPKGTLGLGGSFYNKLKDTSFIFSMTNITNLSILRTHAQTEYCKILETNGILVGPICNDLKKNRAFYDKSMKLGTCLVDSNTK